MGFLQKINVVWQKIGIVQRALLVAVVMACVITAALLTRWASTPKMGLLYTNLPLEEVDRVINKLRDQDIRYELKGGSSVFVPDNQVLELRASLMGEGIPKAGKAGFVGLFDSKTNFGKSPFEQSINFNRAMEDELAKTIEMIDGITLARVHIVRSEETIFATTERKATAAVNLQLQPGWKISPGTIAAITNLVASATENLSPDSITVTDTQGRMLTSPVASNTSVQGANSFLDIKERLENGIETDILKLLEPALGPGRVSVEVAAVLDLTSETVQTTKYEKGEASQETINSTSTIQQAPPGPDGTTAKPSTTDKEETTDITYKLPEIITTRTQVPGKITSLSVAVLVDLSVPPPSVPAETTAGETTPAAAPAAAQAKIMSVTDVEDIVKAAVDPTLLTGENALIVKDMPFYRPPALVESGAIGYEKLSRYIEIARQSSMGILAVCALLALKIFAGARKKVLAESPSAGQAQLDSLGMLPAAQGETSTQMVYRRQINAALQQNPEQVKQLFASWLAEEK